MLEELDCVLTKYSFVSGLFNMEADRYYNEYDIDIYILISVETGDFTVDDTKVLIGKANVQLLLFPLANKNNNPYKLMHKEPSIMSGLGNVIYDFEKKDFKPELKNWAKDSLNGNMLYIKHIELLPPYRSVGIGKKVIKDILYRFDGCYGIMALQAQPIQFRFLHDLKFGTDWNLQMEYDMMEQDKDIAINKLNAFYQSLGFTKLFSDNYFFYNSNSKNTQLDNIEFEL